MNNLLYTKLNNLFSKTKATYISSKTLYNGKFIKLISEKYKLPNNKIIDRKKKKKNSNKESVIIIAITKENKFILVVQNRINELTSIEFPSGYIEENESVEEAANRELQEEVGYISNNITILESQQNFKNKTSSADFCFMLLLRTRTTAVYLLLPVCVLSGSASHNRVFPVLTG